MRAVLMLVVGLGLFVLPLSAEGETALDRAIRMFSDRQGGVRQEGTRVAEKEVRRLLAPLIEAMKSPDAEVRRRAREAILSVVPHHDRGAAPKPQLRVNAWQRGGRVVLLPPQKFQFKVVPGKLRQNAVVIQQIHVVNGLGLQGTFQNALGQARFTIQRVFPKSKAAQAGLRSGDVILSINKRPIQKNADFAVAIDRKKGWTGAVIHVIRGNRLISTKVP